MSEVVLPSLGVSVETAHTTSLSLSLSLPLLDLEGDWFQKD
jgi:hypothetical protein